MEIYRYQDTLYCKACGEDIKQQIKKEAFSSLEFQGLHDYVQHLGGPKHYPQGPYLSGGIAADTPHHCESGSSCLNAYVCRDGTKVGLFLENPLTTHGVEYVCERLEDDPDSEIVQMWANHYKEELARSGMRPYRFKVTSKEVMIVTIKARSESEAKAELEATDYADYEAKYGTKIVDTEFSIEALDKPNRL